MKDILKEMAIHLAFCALVIIGLALIPARAWADDVDDPSKVASFQEKKDEPKGVALSSAVKVCAALSCTTGHGSGFYLGNGYFITAEHVAENQTDWILKAEDNRVIYASVVWTMSKADLALLKVDTKRHTMPINLPSSEPACRAPEAGERVTAVGNPTDILFAHVDGYATAGPITSGGAKPFLMTDAGKAQDIGHWRDAYVFILPVFFGFSGGPVYAADGKVLGLVVGMLQGTPYSIIEPLTKLCGILPQIK